MGGGSYSGMWYVPPKRAVVRHTNRASVSPWGARARCLHAFRKWMHFSLWKQEDDKTSTSPTPALLRCLSFYSALLSCYTGSKRKYAMQANIMGWGVGSVPLRSWQNWSSYWLASWIQRTCRAWHIRLWHLHKSPRLPPNMLTRSLLLI